MDDTRTDLEGVMHIRDDVVVCRKDTLEHESKLRALIQLFKEHLVQRNVSSQLPTLIFFFTNLLKKWCESSSI